MDSSILKLKIVFKTVKMIDYYIIPLSPHETIVPAELTTLFISFKVDDDWNVY